MIPAADRRRAAPWRRATVTSAALASAILGTAFHAVAGGALPSPFVLLVIVALLWAGTSAALGARPAPARLASAVALGQFAVHVALTASAGHSHSAGHAHPTGPVAGAARPSQAVAPGSLSDALGLAAAPPPAVGPDPVALAFQRIAEELTAAHAGMALAHALAGLLVGLWLATGLHGARIAAALRRLATPVAAWWSRPLPIAPLAPDATRARTHALHIAPPHLRPQHRCDVAGRRGPPSHMSSLAVPA